MAKLPDPNELRKRTDEAIKRGQEEQERQRQEAIAGAEQLRREQQAEAAAILAKVPGLCEQAAAAGKSQVAVMQLRSYKDYRPDGKNWNTLTSAQLQGAGAIVWSALIKANFSVSLDHWYDDRDAGFEIKVHW